MSISILSSALARSVQLLAHSAPERYPQQADVRRVQQEWLLERGYGRVVQRPDGQYLVPTDRAKSFQQTTAGRRPKLSRPGGN